MPQYNVATYAHHETGMNGTRLVVSAYLRTFNAEWPGYLNITIDAPSGRVAKKLAIMARRKLEEAQ